MDELRDWDFNIDDKEFAEYPYIGYFYEIVVDNSKPLDERIPEERVIFETICDIQRSSRLHTLNLLAADYTVYFPLELNPDSTDSVDLYGPIQVRRGHRFRGEFYDYTLEGVVEFVRPSQLGMCSVDIKINTENLNG